MSNGVIVCLSVSFKDDERMKTPIQKTFLNKLKRSKKTTCG
jgi:hypothetical protein